MWTYINHTGSWLCGSHASTYWSSQCVHRWQKRRTLRWQNSSPCFLCEDAIWLLYVL